MNAAFAFPVPGDVADEAALALVRGGQVALGTLPAAGFHAGDSVLVTAAAGGAGHLTVQLAKTLGATRWSPLSGQPRRRISCVVSALTTSSSTTPIGVSPSTSFSAASAVTLPPKSPSVKPFGRLVTYNGVGGMIDVNELRIRNQGVTWFSIAQFATRLRDVYDRNQLRLGSWLRPAICARPFTERCHSAKRQKPTASSSPARTSAGFFCRTS
jgi:hypothetical protein